MICTGSPLDMAEPPGVADFGFSTLSGPPLTYTFRLSRNFSV